MANHSGNSGIVTVGGNTVAEVVDFSWDESANIVDNSAINDASDTHLVGSTNAKGTLSCYWDETDTNGQEAMAVGTTGLAVIFKPEGATGTIYSATVSIESVGVAVSRNAIVTRTFGVVVNGAVTPSVV